MAFTSTAAYLRPRAPGISRVAKLRSEEEARDVAAKVGYPVVVRPSYVLGGRAMEVVFDQQELNRYMQEAVQVEPDHGVPDLCSPMASGYLVGDSDGVEPPEESLS